MNVRSSLKNFYRPEEFLNTQSLFHFYPKFRGISMNFDFVKFLTCEFKFLFMVFHLRSLSQTFSIIGVKLVRFAVLFHKNSIPLRELSETPFFESIVSCQFTELSLSRSFSVHFGSQCGRLGFLAKTLDNLE